MHMTVDRSITIGSMFSGMGGLDLAVQQITGATPAWFCEWDDAPAKVLAHHHPDVTNFRDVTQIDWATIPPVDIITGGYPCQPFSRAGQQKGTDDERHLWPHILTAIRALRPRFAFLENVADHLGRGFDTVLADLAKIGWDARWATLRASDVGAPHHRDRLFILAYPGGERPQAERFARGSAEAITWHHDGEQAFPRLGGGADIGDVWNDLRSQWGDHAAAIFQWEILTRPLPLVVEEQVSFRDEELWGRAFPEVKPAMSPEFVEWMIGLPAGHVTGVPGVSRAQQLKMLGNGVVPQQAAYALKLMIGESDEDH